MALSSLCVCLIVVMAQIVLMAQGQNVTCQYADSIFVSGTCFRYNSTMVTWGAGKAFCASMNGALAVVNSSEQVSTSLKNMATFADAWIGANDIDVEGTFIWDSDKSPVGTALNEIWAVGMPNSFFPSYDCGDIYRTSSTLFRAYASDCNDLYGTLCMELPLSTTNSTITTAITTNTPNTSPTTITSTTTNTPTTTKTTPISMTAAQTTNVAPQTTTTATTGATAVTTATNSATSSSTAQSASTVQSDTATSTTPESSTTTSQETSPLSNTELKAIMRGGVEPVKLNLALYALSALVALFIKRDGRLHLP